jgi:parallel beta-helix repeat protein
MKREKLAAAFFAAVIVLGLAEAASAVDGTIEINQAKANAAGGLPYNITASESYRLTGNLTVPTGFTGILVNASQVVIDLNGFSIIGPGGGANGITANSGFVETTVENGTITGMGQGISLKDNSIVKSVHVDSNTSDGITVGNNSVVEGCTANSNTNSNGIVCAGSGCTISGNTANGNSFGIVANGSGSVILHNALNNNQFFGITATDKTTGYGENVLNTSNSVIISSGTSMKNNVCTTSFGTVIC